MPKNNRNFAIPTRLVTRSTPPSHWASQFEALLVRYPDISEKELAKLISLLPLIPMLDKALIIADNRLSPKLADLYRDHRNRRTSQDETRLLKGAVFAVLTVGLLGTCIAS